MTKIKTTRKHSKPLLTGLLAHFPQKALSMSFKPCKYKKAFLLFQFTKNNCYMKRIFSLLTCVAIIASSCDHVEHAVNNDNKKDSSKKETAFVPVDSATAMKNWTNFMTPGDMQKMRGIE